MYLEPHTAKGLEKVEGPTFFNLHDDDNKRSLLVLARIAAFGGSNCSLVPGMQIPPLHKLVTVALFDSPRGNHFDFILPQTKDMPKWASLATFGVRIGPKCIGDAFIDECARALLTTFGKARAEYNPKQPWKRLRNAAVPEKSPNRQHSRITISPRGASFVHEP